MASDRARAFLEAFGVAAEVCCLTPGGEGCASTTSVTGGRATGQDGTGYSREE